MAGPKILVLAISLISAPALMGQIVFKDSSCTPGKSSNVDVADVKGRAERGERGAQFQYGLFFYFGCGGMAEDHAEAGRWWRLAASQDEPLATVDLGQLLLHGDGAPQDVNEAIRLFRRAGDLGEPQGYYHLAHMYALGDGVRQDLAEEAKWYHVLAEHGVVDAMWMTGKFYDEGHGVPEDPEQAKYWWRKAAQAGHQLAATHLAELEAEGGREEAARAAVEDLRKAAGKGNGEAAFELAGLYLRGEGVPQDTKESRHWFEVAAENDYGRIEVANRLWRGRGIAADPTRAFYWYQKVGCELAGYQLGRMYELGEGTSQNYAKAADCYRQGMERATYARLGLADLMEKGQGIPRDEAKALELYRESAEREIGGVAFEIALNFDLGRDLPNDLGQAARWWRTSGCYHNGGAALNLAKKYASGSGVPRSPMDVYVWTALGSDVTYYAKSAHEQIRHQFPVQAIKEGDEYVDAYRERKKRFGAFYEEPNPILKMGEPELRAAAAAGDIDALFSLAHRLEVGEGATTNVSEAIRLYRQAVFEARGDLYVMLGEEYENGKDHVKDMKVAVNLYRSAAEAGSTKAQYRLGLAYQAGEGVEKDAVESFKWFLLASDGNEQAKAKTEELKPALTAKQIATATRDATDTRLSFAR
jgi:uncharacterized protein